MANNLLDPTQTDGEEKSSFEPEYNASQKDYDEKFARFANSPENKAFSDQAESGTRNEFPYSSDKDRRGLASRESEGSTESSPHSEVKDLANAIGSNIPFSRSEGSENKKGGFNLKGLIAKKTPLAIIAGGGGLTTFIIIFVSGLSSQLALVHIKENAENKLSAITNQVLNDENNKIVGRRAMRLSGRDYAKLKTNLVKVDAELAKRGYRLTDNGLEKPDGTILRNQADIKNELNSRAGRKLVRGRANRNAVTKAYAKSLGLPRRSSIAKSLRSNGEDPKKAMLKETRAQAIKGGGNTTSRQLTRAKETIRKVAPEPDEAAKQIDEFINSSDESIEPNNHTFGNKLASSGGEINNSTIKRFLGNATDSIGSRVVSGAGTAFGGTSEAFRFACTAGLKANALYEAAPVLKKQNLTQVATVFMNNADGVITGTVDGQMQSDFMNLVQSDESGQSMYASAGMQFLMDNPEGTSAYVNEDQREWFDVRQKDVDNPIIQGVMDLANARVPDNPVAKAAAATALGGAYPILMRHDYNFCAAATSLEGTILSIAIETIITLIPGAGQGKSLVTAGGGQTAKITVSTALRTALKFGSRFTRSTALSITAEQLTEMWIESYMSNLHTSSMMTFSHGEGGEFTGNGVASGFGAMYESRNRNMGMKPLTRVAYLDLTKKVNEGKRTEYAQKSLYDRFLSIDTKKPNSLAANVLVRAPVITHGNPVATGKNILRSTISLTPITSVPKFIATATKNDSVALANSVEVDKNGFVIDPFGNYIVGNNFNGIEADENFDALFNSGDIDATGKPNPGTRLQEYIDTCTDLIVSDPMCTAESSKTYQAYLAHTAVAAAYEAEFNPQDPGDSSGISTPGIEGIEYPEGITPHPSGHEGYFKIPQNDAYVLYGPERKRYGSRDLIGAIYTVAKAYKAAMGSDSTMNVGNLNTRHGDPSKSHRWGVGVDLDAKGAIGAANVTLGNYSKDATVLLGKLWVDTGMVKNIWWCPNDDSSDIIRSYSSSVGKPINISCVSGHRDHFHIDLKDEFRLAPVDTY